MICRRAMLIAGAGSITVLGLSADLWRRTAPATMAREPWTQASEGLGDPRLDALAYAILAPNPHNMQPWLVRLDGDDSLTLFCDANRLLYETDPPARQITIGFGAFLELFEMAAASAGFRADTTLFPEGVAEDTLDARPVAQITLTADDTLAVDPLFATVLDRRTDRAPYDLNRTPVTRALAQVATAGGAGVRVGTSNEPTMVGNLIDIARAAWEIEWTLDRTRRESVAVTHIGREAVNGAPYGINIDGRLLSALNTLGIASVEDMDTPGTLTYEETQRFYDDAIVATPALIWAATADNTRISQIAAGRTWVRTQLQANALGLSFHPLSQALQEFPEMGEHYATIHELLTQSAGETVQMLARVGYGVMPPAAPREALASKLVQI